MSKNKLQIKLKLQPEKQIEDIEQIYNWYLNWFDLLAVFLRLTLLE